MGSRKTIIMIHLDSVYWTNRYESKNTGWDLGEISPPLKEYFDQLKNKEIKILIPGGGNSYEAEYLHKLQFKNIYVVDFTKPPLANIKKRVPSFPDSHLLHKDFFDVHMKFDLIIEQTFFCALSPSLRTNYVYKVTQLLEDKGKLVGVFFSFDLSKKGPPFGGDKEEYKTLFKHDYKIAILEACYNSTISRKGKELFAKLIKK